MMGKSYLLTIVLMAAAVSVCASPNCADYRDNYPLATPSIGDFHIFSQGSGVAYSGDYAYLACEQGLRIVDVSDPANPVAMGLALCGIGEGVAVIPDTTLVVLAASSSGVKIIDVASPDAPFVVGSHAVLDEAYDVAINDSLVYIADGSSGILILDISDPANPDSVGYVYASGQSECIDYLDGYLYRGVNYSGFTVIDVADPATAAVVGSVGGQTAFKEIVAIAADRIFAIGRSPDDGIYGYDASDPANPTLAGFESTPQGDPLGLIRSTDTRLYVCGSLDISYDYGYLGVVTVGDAASISLDYSIVTHNLNDLALGAGQTPTEIYGFGYTGFEVFDITIPTTPVSGGNLDCLNLRSEFAVYEQYAYLYDGDNLVIVDNSDRSAPVQAATFSVSGDIEDMHVAGDYLYTTGPTGVGDALRVWDLATPTVPTLVATLVDPDFSGKLSSTLGPGGDFVVSINRDDVLIVTLIEPPSSPVLMSKTLIPETATTARKAT